jgi:preprotein translocase subunit SecE
VRSELRKVTFPTRKETMASTAVVLVAVFAIAIYLGIVDAVLSFLISGILR